LATRCLRVHCHVLPQTIAAVTLQCSPHVAHVVNCVDVGLLLHGTLLLLLRRLHEPLSCLLLLRLRELLHWLLLGWRHQLLWLRSLIESRYHWDLHHLGLKLLELLLWLLTELLKLLLLPPPVLVAIAIAPSIILILVLAPSRAVARLVVHAAAFVAAGVAGAAHCLSLPPKASESLAARLSLPPLITASSALRPLRELLL